VCIGATGASGGWGLSLVSKPAAREHSFLKVLGRRITNQRGYCDIPGFMRTQILPLTGRRPET
jgi:hypothetical protein